MLPISGCRIQGCFGFLVFFFLVLRRRFQSPHYQLPLLVWNKLGCGFLCFVVLWVFFFPCLKQNNTVYNCESQSILEAVFQHFKRHFLPVPAPCDGWTHSNFRFPSLTCAVPVLGFFLFYLFIYFPSCSLQHCLGTQTHTLPMTWLSG